MDRNKNTIFTFMQEEIERYQIKLALEYNTRSINRVLHAIKCIKKLKDSNTKMYLVRGLMEAKLLIEFCVKHEILNELIIYNKFNQRIKYTQYSEETEHNNPREYRAYIRVWKGFSEKIDKSKSINEQRIVYLKNWL
jgi:hypothetical protein